MGFFTSNPRSILGLELIGRECELVKEVNQLPGEDLSNLRKPCPIFLSCPTMQNSSADEREALTRRMTGAESSWFWLRSILGECELEGWEAGRQKTGEIKNVGRVKRLYQRLSERLNMFPVGSPGVLPIDTGSRYTKGVCSGILIIASRGFVRCFLPKRLLEAGE